MAEGARRPNFGQRVMGSAKGLACSTLSGVAGIEGELRDPLHAISGKAATLPYSSGRISKESAAARRKASNSKALAAFRSRRASQQQEKAFDEWAGRASEPEFDMLEQSSTTNESSTSALGSSTEGGPTTLPHTYSETRLESDTYSGLSTLESSQATPTQPQLEQSWQKSKTAAKERLTQLERHMSGTFALRTRSTTFVEPYGGLDIQDQHLLHGSRPQVNTPGILEVIRPSSHAELDRPFPTERTSAIPETTYQPLLQSALHPQSGSSPSTRWFTCPEKACHDLLMQQNTNLLLSIHQRCCIHTGCGYVSQDLDGWLTHCTSAHAHATASTREDEGSCPYCKYCEFDTH